MSTIPRIPFKSSCGIKGTIPATALATWLRREDAAAIMLAHRRERARPIGSAPPERMALTISHEDFLAALLVVQQAEELIEARDWYIRCEGYCGPDVPFVGGAP